MILNLHSYSVGPKNSQTANGFFRPVRIALTVLFLAVTYHTSHAQFKKGRILLGGDITFSSMTDKTAQAGFSSNSFNETRLQLTPKVGYFVIDNLAIGADITFITTSGGLSTTSTFLAGPFVRYYIKNLFIEGEYGFGSGKSGDTNTSTTGWTAGIGYAVFLNDYIAIEPTLIYTSNSIDYNDLNHKSTIAGFAAGVGFQIYLGKRN